MAVPGNPLDYWGSDPGNPLYQGSPTWADAIGAYGRMIADQRQRDIQAGLIDPQTGWPTRQGAVQSALGTALGLGTGDLPGIRAYHGSPYSFDAFDASKIGTGEGAQAYGHGLYFAEQEGIARSYRDKLSQTPMDGLNDALLGFQPYSANGPAPTLDNLRTMLATHSNPFLKEAADDPAVVRDISTMLQGHDLNSNTHSGDAVRAASRLDSYFSGKSPGSMYEVNIGADPQHFLDWDKPLNAQSQHVQDALASHPTLSAIIGDTSPTEAMQRGWERQPTAGDWVRQTTRGRTGEMDPAELSTMLRDAGIPGISYYDAGSRGAGQGTRNHVVFDANTIAILRKYGIAGLGLGLGAAATQGNGQQQ